MAQTFGDLVAEIERSLSDPDLYYGHGTDNPFDEAAWLVAHVVGVDLAAVDDLPWKAPVDDAQSNAARALARERVETGKPLAYLINEAWFSGLRFYIDDRAIIPRSHLGDLIVERFEPWVAADKVNNILDLCTGSGCIAIALALSFPDANIVATDLSESALQVARKNVGEYHLKSRVRLVAGDLFAGLGDQRFDLIVCNPPYVSDRLMMDLPREYRYEPETAFAGGREGLDLIDRILRESSAHLSAGGTLVVEAGSAGEALEARYAKVPFTWLASDSGERLVFLMSREELVDHFPAQEIVGDNSLA
jgi:ribosomal protein L3 glutamine methyltransferase